VLLIDKSTQSKKKTQSGRPATKAGDVLCILCFSLLNQVLEVLGTGAGGVLNKSNDVSLVNVKIK